MRALLIILALLLANIALALRHSERTRAESRDPAALTSRLDSSSFAQVPEQQQRFSINHRDPSPPLEMTKLQ